MGVAHMDIGHTTGEPWGRHRWVTEGSAVAEPENERVDLPGGTSASQLLHDILRAAVDQFPDELTAAELPDNPATFRAEYATCLPRFEAARVATPQRTAIARYLAAESRRRFVWMVGEEVTPLTEAMAEPQPPLELETITFSEMGGWIPQLPAGNGTAVADGATGDAIADYTAGLVGRSSATAGVATSVSWLLSDGVGPGGMLDFSARRIAVLGGAAELAPATHWLAAGAHVLWIDVASPPAQLRRSAAGGRLSWAPGGVDLLTQPRRVAATIAEFAAAGPVDIGLYAYAPGKAREWRLTAAMNAIVDALPAEAIATVTLLVSPTTPGQITSQELQVEEQQRRDRPTWQNTLDRLGFLGSGSGHVTVGDGAVSRSVVSIQGSGYQAAQYLEKMMTAETWATWGPALATAPQPRHVSANVAGVSLTRSLQHPVFDAAFGGATAFQVETFAPGVTRSLNAMLTARDWLDPTAAGNPAASFSTQAERALELLTSARVHGGLYVLPYPADPALKVSAAIGAARHPSRIPAMVRRSG